MSTGLLQFGAFNLGEAVQPFRINLDLLPSYPEVLQQLATLTNDLLNHAHYDHLLSTIDAIPFGVALSLHTQKPLVYSRGGKLSPAYDLVGAYDVGHPAVLLTNVIVDGEALKPLIGAANRVGLAVHTIISIFSLSQYIALDDITVTALLPIHQVLAYLGEIGYLTEHFIASMYQMLSQFENGANYHHPTTEQP